jgi:ABC-2 type transport system ATP-binding protein
VHNPDLIISTRDLTKRYRQQIIVDRINLSVPRGSICGFLGANGAGKTTTIKLLLGLVKPSEGSGTVFGKDIVRESVGIRERVGFLAQSPSFYGHLTARETLKFVASFFFKGSRSAIAARIEDMIDLVGLAGRADRPVRGFSGGERQRLGIAQAAINEPELMILDEPAAALDPLGRRDVLQILESLRGRSTVFYSTHILDDVQRVSDRVVILNQGQIAAQGAIDELLDRNVFQIKLRGNVAGIREQLGSIPWIRAVEIHEDTLNVHVSDSQRAEVELLRLVMADSDAIVLEFGRSNYALEDVFVNLVKP